MTLWLCSSGGLSCTIMTSKTLLNISANMTNAAMCDTFLRVAQEQYTDMLPRVRIDAARAMTGWMVLFGYRALVQWSDVDDCFIGCVQNAGSDFVSFHGKTAAGVKEAFEKAVRDYMVKRTDGRRAGRAELAREPENAT